MRQRAGENSPARCLGKRENRNGLFQKLGITFSVLYTSRDPAEGRGGNIRLGHDLVIGTALHQQLGREYPLCHVFDFLDGA